MKSLLQSDESSASEVITYLKQLSPSGIELEFLTLNEEEDCQRMLQVFIQTVKQATDFDFVMALINNFLMNQNDIIVNEPKLVKSMGDLNIYRRSFLRL